MNNVANFDCPDCGENIRQSYLNGDDGFDCECPVCRTKIDVEIQVVIHATIAGDQ